MVSFKNKETLISNGQTKELQQARRDILHILQAAMQSVDPYKAVQSHIKDRTLVMSSTHVDTADFDHVFMVAFGKGSVPMAQAVCDQLPVSKGIALTNDQEAQVDHSSVDTYYGTHPLPSEKNIMSTQKILELLRNCTEDDLLLVLISGGGSALLCNPTVKLGSMQQTTEDLMKAGATIQELNTVRKHLSQVKGGKLLTHISGCTTVSLVISDVVGDPIEFIASGPTYPDPTTYDDAWEILKKYGLLDRVSDDVQSYLKQGIHGEQEETLEEDNPVFSRVHNSIVASNKTACNTALQEAKKQGYTAEILSTCVTGEARKVGQELVLRSKKAAEDLDNPLVFITGGETTVMVTGNGMGGRNQELVLGAVKELAEKNIVLASFATDGIDGDSDAAGAIADGFTLQRARKKELLPEDFLNNNDSYWFFKQLQDLLITGSTGTNVMDIQVLLLI